MKFVLFILIILLGIAVYIRTPDAPKNIVYLGKKGESPSLIVYKPEIKNKNHAAVIICPGGGYSNIASGYEGEDIAEWLNDIGITAFVLNYRLAPEYTYPAQLDDLLLAIRTVRYKAKKYKIDENRIGVAGFSAGGHLAAMAGVHFNEDIGRISNRPDFMILGYPVITMLPAYTNEIVVTNLGVSDDKKLREYLSAELQVTKKTPPSFIFHTADDEIVPVENSKLFYEALKEHNVPAELHIYKNGPHGVGLANGKSGTPDLPDVAKWTKQAESWMRKQGIIK